MTRRLVLVRHAKAADGLTDVRRPLAGRGETDAPAIGRLLVSLNLVPDRVVVSPALRARQTWQLAATELTSVPEPVIDGRIYDNHLDALAEVVRETPVHVEVLVLVGHNPSVHAFALDLDDGSGDAHARHELSRRYPTGGVSVFTVAGAWDEIDEGAGRLDVFGAARG